MFQRLADPAIGTLTRHRTPRLATQNHRNRNVPLSGNHVTAHLADRRGRGPGYTLFDLADRLRTRGWQVPAYT